jgi:hypothetical protein
VHEEAREDRPAEMELKWGVMNTNNEEPGHCGFSTLEVESPEEGKLYV